MNKPKYKTLPKPSLTAIQDITDKKNIYKASGAGNDDGVIGFPKAKQNVEASLAVLSSNSFTSSYN